METKFRIMLVGAHPDDCEGKGGGYAAKMAALGHRVAMLSITDGSLGHFELNRHKLIDIRREEAEQAASSIGAESIIMDIPDGELVSDLATRKKLTAVIRDFAPNLIITHRPNDYHTDHRNASLLVQDASYMLGVPGFVPGTPSMRFMPHVMYFHDSFKNPVFEPDVVISIDDVIEKKFEMMACHASQYFEWLPWMDGRLEEIPESYEERLMWIRRPLLDEPDPPTFTIKQTRGEKALFEITKQYRGYLEERYGDSAEEVKFVEAFECCEYGAGFTQEHLEQYFPF